MKRILIPTDFSKHSRHTLQYVLELLQGFSTPWRILLVNTYMIKETDPNEVIKINDALKGKSKQGLELERELALQYNKNPLLTIDVASHMGSLTNVVLQLLRSENIDLVAMGKNGGRNVESVANLLKQQQCSLLITYINEVSIESRLT